MLKPFLVISKATLKTIENDFFDPENGQKSQFHEGQISPKNLDLVVN